MTSAAIIRRRRGSTSLLSLYSVLGIRPELAFDFADERYFTSRVPTTFSSAITHTRASTATYVDSDGVLQTAEDGVPRVGHHVWNGSAWVNEGLLHESEARTNLLHTTNALVTQSYTVTAVPHTLHFTGTGTVTLSGASTAGPLVGTGTGEENRVSLTFTPTAASLTLTVSGTVTDAQLEIGSTPSSYIPNLAGSGTVTRAAEVLTVPAANLPWNPLSVSIQMDGRMTYADNDDAREVRFSNWNAFSSNQIEVFLGTNGVNTGQAGFAQYNASVVDFVLSGSMAYSPGILVPYNIASRHGSTFINGAVDGTALPGDITPTALPDLSATDLNFAFDYMGTIRTFRVWSDDLGDDGIEEATEGEPSSYLLWDATADTYVSRIYD